MLNKVILMGRLTADPEQKQTPSGVSVTSFSIAVDRNYSGKGKQTDFINIVAWRQTAEFISKYFSKGRLIALEGSLQSRSYEDRNGSKRTVYEVVVEQAHFADSKQERTPPSNFPVPDGQSAFDGNDFEEVPADDSQLPF